MDLHLEAKQSRSAAKVSEETASIVGSDQKSGGEHGSDQTSFLTARFGIPICHA